MTTARRDAFIITTTSEQKAVCKVMVSVTNEALLMALSTPKAERPGKLLALHATIPNRLIAEGIAAERAVELAPLIKVTKVEVSDDLN
jgi:hypothetical protein